MRPVLFLNLEGVCHPTETQYIVAYGRGRLGPAPFCWAEPLKEVAQAWDLSIVLRSAVTAIHGVETVRQMAPAWLQKRIAGAASDVVRFIDLDRVRKVNTSFGVMRRYVEENEVRHWLALCDDDDGWPALTSTRRHLVRCDQKLGLSEPGVIGRLRAAFIATAP